MSKFIKIFFTLLVLVLLDQASKTYFISHLKNKEGFTVNLTPFLDFVYAWNYGISFGFFRQYYQYSNYILLILNSVIVLYLISLLIRANSKLAFWGLNLIIGGAIGNLVDRVIRGAVFDFIFFNYENLDFPAFNLADCFISIGAMLFIYDYLFHKKSLAPK